MAIKTDVSVLKKAAPRRAASPRRRTYLAADDRRAQILEVAKRVFARAGFHAANIADICTAAQIGRGTLYQYFDNKRAVMLAVMEEIERRVERVLAERPQVAAIPEARGAPPALVAAFCERRLRELLDAIFLDTETLRLVLRDARGLDRGVDRVIAAIERRAQAALEDDLRAAQRAGLLRPTDLRLTARYLFGGVEKLVLAALAEDATIDRDAIVRTAVEIQLFGLLAAPAATASTAPPATGRSHRRTR